MEGMLMFQDNVIKPPFDISQEADRLLVNGVQVYPPPEVTTIPDVKMLGWEDVFTATEGAWVAEKMADAGAKIKTFFESKAGSWSEFRHTQFSAQADEAVSFLERQGLKTERSSNYGDILVPITSDYGVVALFNEQGRIDVMRKIEQSCRPETVFEYDAVKDLADYIESNLAQGHFIRFDDNHMEAIPRDLVEAIQKQCGEETWGDEQVSFDDLSYEQRVAGIARQVRDVRPMVAVATRPCSAIIFFPHRSWQKEVVGRASTYWAVLANKLLAENYKVSVYLDTAVTLNLWATVLKNGKSKNLRVIYNEGHGGGDLIDVGEPNLKGGWLYFRSSFVKKYANLSNTAVFIHSCATMSDNKMASAFVGQGACAYLGWQHNTSANPDYCDKVDALFWEQMIDVHSTAIYAKQNVATVDNDFLGHGNRYCRIPIRDWKC